MYKNMNEEEYDIEQYTIENFVNKYTKTYYGNSISKNDLESYFIYIITCAKEHNHIPENYFFNKDELSTYMNRKYGNYKHGKWKNVILCSNTK